MRLQVKSMDVEAARPVAFISQHAAEALHVHEGERLEIRMGRKKIIATIDTMKDSLSSGEIILSKEIFTFFEVTKIKFVEVFPLLEPESVRAIIKKFHGGQLDEREIFSIIQDISRNALTEAEIAYFVSAVAYHGMSLKETIWLTAAMAHTGKILTWDSKEIADKHSIGGIPNNRTTPIVVSICAAAGIVMPKTSSRAITTASATADTMGVITNVVFSAEELKRVVKKTNACLAWGGSLGLAPADDKLIRIEHILNVDPEAQLLASILAKKIACGSTHILIDIPCGKTAKVSKKSAEELKKKFIAIGKSFHINIEVVITDGSQPIGNGIGPVLEMRDVLAVLQQKEQPLDLEKKALFLAGRIFEMMNRAPKNQGESTARKILTSGAAYTKFLEIIKAQGLKNNSLTPARYKKVIQSPFSGMVSELDNKGYNFLGRILGCPADIRAGMYLHKHASQRVKKGEPLLTLYAESQQKLTQGIEFVKKSPPFSLRKI